MITTEVPPPAGADAPPDPGPKKAPRIRLEFLDGLRGLTALYVLLHHLFVPKGLPPAVVHSLAWLRYGHYAVAIFIVLSGYCLMLPVVRAGDGRIPGGLAGFFRRRARRILPPYYAALVLSLAFLWISRRATTMIGVVSGDKTWASNWTPGSLLSHLFLVHNWNEEWNHSINGAFWSVATEWQIYFLFPLLLLPVWRRLGSAAAVAAGLAVGVLPALLLPARYDLSWASPWYAGLFALGMAGATLSFSARPSVRVWHDRLPWGVLAAAGFGGFALVAQFLSHGMHRFGILAVPQPWTVDVLIGAGAASLIVFCAKHAETDGRARPVILRMLESRPAVALGVFSYSIYLVSLPLGTKLNLLLGHKIHSPLVVSALMFAVGLPLILALCYVFHLAFERRFQRTYPAVKPAPVA